MTAQEIARQRIAALLAEADADPPCRQQTGRTLADYEAEIERRAAQIAAGDPGPENYRNDGLCPRCGVNPKANGYCRQCRREIQRDWDRRNQRTSRARRQRRHEIGATK